MTTLTAPRERKLTSPQLVELDGKIADRRKKLADVFSEAGDSVDLDKVTSLDGTKAEKLDQIRSINEELTDLAGQKSDVLALLIAADNAMRGGDTLDGADLGVAMRAKTWLDQIVDSGTFAHKKVAYEFDDIELKTVLSTSAGWAPAVQRTDRLVDYPLAPLDILDFIPTVTITSPQVSYMEETTFTNAAVETAEGAAKPEATLAYTERVVTARKIPVLIPVTDEQLEDVPRMRQIIETRLPMMVRQRLAGQIVNGDGAGVNIRGILNTVGIQTQAKGADPAPDAVLKAMTKVRTVGMAEPDAGIFSATDWQNIRLLRTADGIYIWGAPSEAGPQMIWGIRALIVLQLAAGTAVVGAWQMYSELDVKKGMTVESGYVNDDFAKNKETIRAEIRAVPVFYRPPAFCSVTGL